MFEDFSKKLSVFGQQMVKKTGEVAEIASLKTKTLAKKKKIQDEMLALGKVYYEAHKNEITEFEDKITAINTMYTELECLEEEMKALKEKLPEDSIFEDEDLTGTPAEEDHSAASESEESIQEEDANEAEEAASDTEAEPAATDSVEEELASDAENASNEESAENEE